MILLVKFLQAFIQFVIIIICFIIKTLFPQRKTQFLIGSNYGQNPDPNATVLYEYIRSLGHSVFLVQNNPTNSNLELTRGSLRCCLYFLNANAAFYTHSLSDIIPHAHRLYFLRSIFPKHLLFLQHGVIGLKKFTNRHQTLQDYLLSLEKTFEHMIISSEMERKILTEWGIDESKLALTGLPRFDRLTKRINTKSILVFLTWQHNDEYSIKLNEIVNSKALAYLRNCGYQIHIAEHNMQRNHLKLPQKEILSHLVNTAWLLITDNSSIAWDFFYRDAKVIFYKPNPSWLFEPDDDLRDMIVNNPNQLFQRIVKITEHQSKPKKITFASHYDQQNCRRVFHLVQDSQ